MHKFSVSGCILPRFVPISYIFISQMQNQDKRYVTSLLIACIKHIQYWNQTKSLCNAQNNSSSQISAVMLGHVALDDH